MLGASAEPHQGDEREHDGGQRPRARERRAVGHQVGEAAQEDGEQRPGEEEQQHVDGVPEEEKDEHNGRDDADDDERLSDEAVAPRHECVTLTVLGLLCHLPRRARLWFRIDRRALAFRERLRRFVSRQDLAWRG
jgi:hypothetical protein